MALSFRTLPLLYDAIPSVLHNYIFQGLQLSPNYILVMIDKIENFVYNFKDMFLIIIKKFKYGLNCLVAHGGLKSISYRINLNKVHNISHSGTEGFNKGILFRNAIHTTI